MLFLLNAQHGIMEFTFELLKIRYLKKPNKPPNKKNHLDRLLPLTEAGIILFHIYYTFCYSRCLFAFGAFLSLDSGNTFICFFFGFQSVSLSDSHVSHSSLQVSSTAREYLFHLNKQKTYGRAHAHVHWFAVWVQSLIPYCPPKHLQGMLKSLGFAKKWNK